jgi:hypothetical protein
MTRANWKGCAGWQSVDDPTGALENICLHASAGAGQLCEDYLVQEIGTSNAFAKVHYRVLCDFALASEAEDFQGSLSLVARAGNYTTSVKKPIVPQDAYIAVLDVLNSRILILRRFEAKDFLLLVSEFNLRITPGAKYSLSFACYGNGAVGGTRLELVLNNTTIASGYDGSGLQLLSGSAGLQVQNGSVYVNNFAVMELDSSGFPV